MAKVQIKSEIIASYGGIFKIMELFERLGLGKLVDSSLGKRDASWNAFQYSDVIESLFCNYLCGGDSLEDINMLKAGEEVTLDFDHQFIPAHKFDAKYSYKKDYGYFPGWASVGGIQRGAVQGGAPQGWSEC